MRKVLLGTALLACFVNQAARAESEEQRLARITSRLKPINDSQWNEIAGSKSADKYEIQKGDTLWDVSKKLFGNPYYWPKVWSFNNEIANPHVIAPGKQIVFTSGGSESLPQLKTETNGGEAAPSRPLETAGDSKEPAIPPPPPSGSHEYEKVPKDKWSPVDYRKFQNATKYDSYGIDKELKIEIPKRFSFRVPAIVNDATLPYLGEVVGSRRDGMGLSQLETVFVKSDGQDLQVGTTYSVLDEPEALHDRKSDRSGYLYNALGEIRIIGVKDELYVGVITRAYDMIRRGNRLYPLLPLVTDIKPVASSVALEALVTFGHEVDTQNTAQFRIIHFDRGIEDGVQIGNVFRVYDYNDPVTHDKVSDSDFLINADAIVVHATAQFSTALVLRSRNTFTRGNFGVLLTDVSDLEKKAGDASHDLGGGDNRSDEDKELDELDKLDKASGSGLGDKEQEEVKELDHWDKTKDKPAEEPTIDSSAEKPTDSMLDEAPNKAPAPKAAPEPEGELISPKSPKPAEPDLLEGTPKEAPGASSPHESSAISPSEENTPPPADPGFGETPESGPIEPKN